MAPAQASVPMAATLGALLGILQQEVPDCPQGSPMWLTLLQEGLLA